MSETFRLAVISNYCNTGKFNSWTTMKLTLICWSFFAEFTQGMILPTANGVAKSQSPSQSKASQEKTLVCAWAVSYIFKPDSYSGIISCNSSCAVSVLVCEQRIQPSLTWLGLCFVVQISSSSSTAPINTSINTGVKIPTCKFSIRETFLTSPAELYRVFLNQEVRPVVISVGTCCASAFTRRSFYRRTLLINVFVSSTCRWFRPSHMVQPQWMESGEESFVC